MKLLRITDHRLYNSLKDHEKIAYRLGLPVRYMGHKIKSMVFVDYSVGTEFTRTVSAVTQKKWTIELKQNMSRHNNIGGIVGCYSSPTDTAAFECAGSIFEACLKAGMSSTCISASRIAHDPYDIPKNDVYLIYGITDLPNPNLDRNLTSFLYERDGSLRIVVLAGSPNTNPWQITQNQLRIKFDVILLLNDNNDKNSGHIERVG